MSKLRAILLITAALAVAFTGLAQAAPTVIRFAYANADRDPIEIIQGLVDEFNAQQSNIKVVVEDEYGSSIDKLVTHMAGGAAADIIHAFNELAVAGVQKGLFLNLSPLIARDKAQDLVKDFLPAILESYSYNGNLYGFPQGQSVGVMFYNRDLFAQYGLEAPPDNWGWEEFATYAKKLTKFNANGAAETIGYEQNRLWLWNFWWFESAGVDFSRPDVLPLDTPAAMKTMEFLSEIANQGYGAWSVSLFPKGKGGMNANGAWQLLYWKNSKVPLGVAQVPIGPAKRVALTNSNIVAINRDTPHVEECWTFLKWWYSRNVQLKYLRLLAQQPARLSLGPYWVEAVKEMWKSYGNPEIYDLHKATWSATYSRPQPFFSNAEVINNFINPALDAILRKKQPYPTVLENAAKTGTAFLQETAQK